MTSPGLKRPLDLELTGSASDQASNSATETGDAGVKSSEIESSGMLDVASPNHHGELIANGTKRRCTNTNSLTNPIEFCVRKEFVSCSAQDATMRTDQKQQISTESNHSQRDPSASSLDEEIINLLHSELFESHQQNSIKDLCLNRDEQITLTTRQLRSLCERLVYDRERKLRDEYDRRLASKLAEQYDLFAKANYLNTFAEPSRTQTPSTTIALESKPVPAISNQPVSMGAIAASFMQRATPRSSISPVSLSNPMPNAATSMPDLTTIAATLSANGHHGAMSGPHHHLAPYHLQQQQAVAATAMRLAQQQQQRISMPIISANGLIPSGPVLLTSNLDEQLATPEALFTLFGVFGDVIRVKILFNKKDNALIQMADASRADVAQSYLDKQRIFGKVIRVNRSKHQLVQMPRDGVQSDAGLTKDFTNSPLHRFKIPNSRNYLNIYPPSNTLHVSNIPPTIDESDLHKAFKGQCGLEFTSFKFFPKDRKMALMRFNSVEHATIALIKMHNYQISDENNLRVSFSKSAL